MCLNSVFVFSYCFVAVIPHLVGLWMSWSEWLDVINSVDGIELLVWHRSPNFASMVLRKCANQPSSQFVITNELSIVEENIRIGLNTVYCGPDAESSVKSLISCGKNKNTLLKSLTILDKNVGYESLDVASLSVRFNTIKSGVLGANLLLPHNATSLQLTGQTYGSQTKLEPESKVWTKEEISIEVEKSVRRIVSCGSDHIDHSASLMDVGIDSLAMAEFTSSLRSHFNTEIPSTIVFNHPTIDDIAEHLCESLGVNGPNDPPRQVCLGQSSHPPHSGEDTISIVGMSCRFPGGASSPNEYWKIICDGSNTSSHIPFSRWDAFSLAANSEYLSENEKLCIVYGSFVNDMECFDSSAFNISEREAEAMSPQQRILLECSYMTLLDAGFTADTMKSLNCGVFVGGGMESPRRPSNCGNSTLSVYSLSGAMVPFAAGRISYIFNFQGPNAVYDTACSSSMVAFESALSSLQEGKCGMALVAGVNSLFESRAFEPLARAGMLSKTGRCHSFDMSADG